MHTVQHRVDHLESLVNLFSNFRTSQDDLAADEYEKHNLGLNHTIDLKRRRVSAGAFYGRNNETWTPIQGTYKTRKELRFVRAEMMMARRKAFETDRELDIARADNVLDLEVRELGVKPELLDDSCVFTRRQARVLERHVSRRKA